MDRSCAFPPRNCCDIERLFLLDADRERGVGEGSHDTGRQMTAEILLHGNLAAKNSAVLLDLPRSVLPRRLCASLAV